MHHKHLQMWFGLVALGVVGAGACRTDENLSTAENPEQIVVRTLAVPTNGLIGKWKLDGNVTDTKNGFTTTLTGSPPFIGAQIGQGLDLTGNGTGGTGEQYVEVSQSGSATLDDLQEGAAYSISAWFNPDTTPSGSAPANFWMGRRQDQLPGDRDRVQPGREVRRPSLSHRQRAGARNSHEYLIV